MPTNVTQKYQTLQQVIDWCEKQVDAESNLAGNCREMGCGTDAEWYEARVLAFNDVIDHCASMLGYTGAMPLEVKNQSEDAK